MRQTLKLTTAPSPCTPTPAQRRRGRRRQHLAALAANLAAVCAGVSMGWTSPALPILLPPADNATAYNSSEFTFDLDAANASESAAWLSEDAAPWLGALLPLGAVAGALPAGLLAEALGRRRALLALALPFILGWSALANASPTMQWLLFLGRFLTGIGTGATTALVPLYCEEIAEVPIRGALGTYLAFMICVGVLWIYTLGAYLPYFWFTLTGCVWPNLFLLAFFWMPESPIYLISKGNSSDARKSLEWLRGGPSDEVQLEFDNIVSSYNETSSVSAKQSLIRLFSTNPLRSTTARAVSIVLCAMLFQQLSGINAILFYSVNIFNTAGSNLSGEACSIVLGIVQILAVLLSSLTVDRLGRRFLLLLSTVIMANCYLSFSLYAYFYQESAEETPSLLRWIPLTSLILYIVAFATGFGPLPFLLMAELLPMHAKGWGSAIAMAFNWKIALIVTKEFPVMLKNLGQDITYGIFSIFCILGAVFVVKCIPETKGKNKSEIEESIGGDKP